MPLEAENPIEKPHWLLAREGINLIINNDAENANKLFLQHTDSLPMYAGYAISVFMDGLMTLEEDKINLALQVLKELEKKCSNENGWLKAMTSKVFNNSDVNKLTLAENLETQIILADSMLCLSILTFMQQDIAGYVKGSWVLRKSWKIYQNVYSEVLSLYNKKVGEFVLPDVMNKSVSTDSILITDSGNSEEVKAETTKPKMENGAMDIDEDTITRLMEAVSFGYGLFQLGMSLLPPSLLRFTHFLGFVGNRNHGTSCLMYSRLGIDMRAPLASLALLWYYTIVRPFYALDGTNIKAGVDFACQLIEESKQDFSDSALFLFFKGRVCRLKSDITGAIDSFESSSIRAQREIRNLSMHEVGWCHLIQLDFQNAEATFGALKIASRWSKHFYHYLAAICKGCYTDCSDLIAHFVNSINRGVRGNQLDDFLSRRANYCSSFQNSPKSTMYYKFLVYEMLYLWNAMASCTPNNIDRIIQESLVAKNNQLFVEPMVGISELILGCAYCIQEQYNLGIERFRQCLDLRKNIACNSLDSHVSAFAQYELGSLLLKSTETKEEGKQLLLTLNKYKDYDFEQRLTVRVHSILKHL